METYMIDGQELFDVEGQELSDYENMEYEEIADYPVKDFDSLLEDEQEFLNEMKVKLNEETSENLLDCLLYVNELFIHRESYEIDRGGIDGLVHLHHIVKKLILERMGDK